MAEKSKPVVLMMGTGKVGIGVLSCGPERRLRGIRLSRLPESGSLKVGAVVSDREAAESEAAVDILFADPSGIDVLVYQLMNLKLSFGETAKHHHDWHTAVHAPRVPRSPVKKGRRKP